MNHFSVFIMHFWDLRLLKNPFHSSVMHKSEIKMISHILVKYINYITYIKFLTTWYINWSIITVIRALTNKNDFHDIWSLVLRCGSTYTTSYRWNLLILGTFWNANIIQHHSFKFYNHQLCQKKRNIPQSCHQLINRSPALLWLSM